MSKLIEVMLYSIDELSEEAKEVAREEFRRSGSLLDEWWEYSYEDFREACKILGIEVTNIWFTGFYSQGDGACFEGRYKYSPGANIEIRRFSPEDIELHRIADELVNIQKKNFYKLYALVKHEGRYYHEGTMRISVDRDDQDPSSDAYDLVSQLLRDLAIWLYKRLEEEYEYRNSDEVVDESLRFFGCVFKEDGKML